MAVIAPVRLRVDDPSGVAPVRRAAEQLADDLGFDERRKGEVAIVVTELATNLVRHGSGGEKFAALVEEEWEKIKDGPLHLPQAEIDRIHRYFAPPA